MCISIGQRDIFCSVSRKEVDITLLVRNCNQSSIDKIKLDLFKSMADFKNVSALEIRKKAIETLEQGGDYFR